MWWSSDLVEGLRNLGLEISRVGGKKTVIDHDKTNQRIDELIELINQRLSQGRENRPLMVLDFSNTEADEVKEPLKTDSDLSEYEKFGLSKEDWDNTPENSKNVITDGHEAIRVLKVLEQLS